ncbi:T9SS type A sorting domain-containing protein [Winogradskyella marincola]|uniref:T9SS type A sorting domain-containing protein n=1 Tax=Winogradskyella marincola TaxID=3037795 RepID=A0ABT6G0B7_9FLAO|nr:T9SS type A sorting domain-containing protein [Winogradskyella sp. YYF002]MDG4715458.1 T9SS type A sorting domain-containing protein [Winogradskyella sp. YYF002]
MKSILNFTIFCLLSFISISAQQFILETGLDTTVNETSGLLYINNTLITHNDSANTNQLFDIDLSTGNVTRTVTITNATNVDWEDLTQDDTYIYIGDFGNYEGDRTDLKVYRIAISDYLNNTSVTADVINFSYADQTDFTTSPFATNFDAESLIHYNNSLYVFTRNWLDGNTNIYELPKTPGSHSISMVDSITAGGLVSGATFNILSNEIIITGFDGNGAFLIELTGFNSGLFSNGTVTKTSIAVPENYSFQIEGICPINAEEYYITAEENGALQPALYSFNTSTLSVNETELTSISFYPNPAKTQITLSEDNLQTKIYNITGQLVKASSKKHIDVSDLTSGIYLITIEDTNGKNTIRKRLLIE